MRKDAAVYSVTQVNEFIKTLIEGTPFLSDIYVKGEISNFTNHYKTGHFYFTLKDNGSLIKAIMFKGYAEKLAFVPENGMNVILHGRISEFVRDGQYQIYADSMEPDGIGSLYLAYEQLKNKLSKEGLFDEKNKKPLPKIPSSIGIITSPTGAAIRDIINISTRRFPYAKLVLYPALVQGDGASESLISGIEYFNSSSSVDLIIIGRGGGSIEDLWAFNNEALARKIAFSSIPVISAVGHETDFTICDFVADKRAPTPSAAAEISVPETLELMHKFDNITARTALLLSNRIKTQRERLNGLKKSGIFTDPSKMFDQNKNILLADSIALENEIQKYLVKKNNSASVLAVKLEALNPLSVLIRGYSVAYLNSKNVKSIKDVKTGDKLSIKVSDGVIDANVSSVSEKQLTE